MFTDDSKNMLKMFIHSGPAWKDEYVLCSCVHPVVDRWRMLVWVRVLRLRMCQQTTYFLGFCWLSENTYYLFVSCIRSWTAETFASHGINHISLLLKKKCFWSTLHHELCVCVMYMYVSGVCVCVMCVCRWVQQSSPSSGVCQWLTVKAEGRELRQYRVMRDVVNRLGHASVTAAAQLTWHVSSTPRRFVYASPVKPGEEAEVETGAH